MTKVSFKVNKGNKSGDFGYSPLNRGCPLNTGFTVLYLYLSKPRLKGELRKQQYNVTLFGTRNSSLANATIYVSLQFLLCFNLNLRAISEYKPPWACIWRGDLSEGFLGYFIYLEWLILRYVYHLSFLLHIKNIFLSIFLP